MASIRTHPRSPYWFLKRRDLDTGKWVEKSTGLRTDSPEDTRKAQRLADKASSEERRIGAPGTSPAFQAWVPSYIQTHWGNSHSQKRYQVAWQAIKAFLAVKWIVHPRQIKYGHGREYIAWRGATHVHGRKVGHNTALLELKFLSQLMNEAVRMGHAETNPLARLGIGRTPYRIKPELTDDEIGKLREGLKTQPEWMGIAFEIALYTGCRFSECSIPMENIDLVNGTIRLRDAKRGENDPRKYFTVPLHPSLKPSLVELAKNGVEFTCVLSGDKNGRINKYFKKLGINASFHSLRVTFVTRCHRGGLSESEAMRLVNHSSSLIHRIYSRLNVEDVRAAQKKIPLP